VGEREAVRREIVAEHALALWPVGIASIIGEPAELALELLGQAHRPGEVADLLQPVKLFVVEDDQSGKETGTRIV
jgi:hypothetical protein